MSAPTAPPPVRPAPVPERRGRVAELRELSRTTPGVLIKFTAALVVASVLVGVFTAISVQSRAQALDNLATRSGPLSVAAQDLYRSLSDADATSNSAFLSGGLEPAAVRTRYETDLAQAEDALAIAVAARDPADLADPDSPLSILSSQLTVYAGLVETARAYNRQGLPVGAAYQREASTLMREKLLPAAERLYDNETAALAEDQDRAAFQPVIEVMLGLALLVLLFYAQRFVRRRTQRRLNVGLVVATGATLVSLLWVLIATIGVLGRVETSRDEGSELTNALVDARVDGLAARRAETLTLVARGSGAAFEEAYGKARAALAGQLVEAQSLSAESNSDVWGELRAAIIDESAWQQVHTQVRQADDGGDYTAAVQLANSAAAEQFDNVDRSLRDAIANTTAIFEREVSSASSALTGTVVGVILLALVTAAGAVIGIWQRLKEYR
ncbi:hypothetical protein [Actinophytocola sp.]|uniref:hypothetical protein n=1 Tax=Actinophytocola sp. TaxID=1872138 RepID=UPI002ED677BF